MTNLFTGEIEAKTFKTVESLSDVTFTVGSKYQLQLDGIGYIREGTTGKGFIIREPLLIDYIAGSDDLYIQTDRAVLNIASVPST